MSLRSLILGNTGLSSRPYSLLKFMRYEGYQTQHFQLNMSLYAVKCCLGGGHLPVYNLGLLGDVKIRAGPVKRFVTKLLIAFINIFSSTHTDIMKLI